VRFRLLGAVEVEGAHDAALLRRTKVRALLALLLLNANRAVSIDRLVEGLWGDDPPDTAIGALQNYVSQLRKVLGADAVVTRPPGYAVVVAPEEVDLETFRRLVREAEASEDDAAAPLLRQALELWRAPALDDLAGEPVHEQESGPLESERFRARHRLFEAELALGGGEELVPELESWVREDPSREVPWRLLMLALYRAGRQGDALSAFREARATLVELGLDPSPELQELQRAILRHDPALLPASASRARAIRAPAGGARRTVTVVFVDVVRSTALAAALDPENLRDVMSSFFVEMSDAVERHGGVVEKFAGDEVLAVFGAPTAHEDDALRAVRAAVDMQAAARALNDGLSSKHGQGFAVRIGINTGEVVAGHAAAGGTFVTGSAVNVGKRLQQAAAPGDLVLSASTLALVREAVSVEPLEPIAVPDVAEPVTAFRLLFLDVGAPGPARSYTTPLVGREDELTVLRGAFELARTERRCVRMTVVGNPGIGKTRLAVELLNALEDEAQTLVGRCVEYGDGATYLPLRDALKEAPDEHESVLRLRELVAPDSAAAVAADILVAARGALEALAQERAVAVVFDDVQWAEETFLDLIEYLGLWIKDAPVLLLSIARPDVFDHRPEWRDADSGPMLLRLGALEDADVRTLVDEIAGKAMTETERELAVRGADGYPFFAEQLVAWSAEAGGLEEGAVPPTIDALLASRLDRLDPPERAVLERAAVIGRDFWQGAVSALTPEREIGGVERHLLSLMRKGFIRPTTSGLPEENAWRFHHVLIRDVAYAAIPKATRAELHALCADWLDEHADGLDEIVGYHLEQAFVYRQELGPARTAARLGADAAERLGAAGVGALARGDAPAAVGLLTRAVDVLPEGQSPRVELLCELGISHRLRGDAQAADEALARAVDEAERFGDPRTWHRARLELTFARVPTGRASAEDAIAAALAAIPAFEATSDERGLGRAWLALGYLRGSFLSDNAGWEEGLERALEHYRRAGWPTSTCLQQLAVVFFGPRPAREAIARCEQLLEVEVTDVVGEAHVRVWYGGVLALQARFDEAREQSARARSTYEELAHPISTVACDTVDATIAMLAGDHAAAESVLRSSVEWLEAHGELPLLANRAGDLADALWFQGRYEEAAHWSAVAAEHTSPGDLAAEFTWRSVRAKALAALGDVDAAETLAAEAVELVDRTDSLNQRGSVHLAHAHVLLRAGKGAAAAEAARRAQELFEQKENVVGAAWARELGRETGA
jgi:class 3 adenylate cyclase/tetratricopeptide (TPR) repeat protein